MADADKRNMKKGKRFKSGSELPYVQAIFFPLASSLYVDELLVV